MAKRKAVKKAQAKQAKRAIERKRENTAKTTTTMPVPALAIKILSIILAIILVISLTLYIWGKMSSKGFWMLALFLAIIAFGLLPWMRKKYAGG